VGNVEVGLDCLHGWFTDVDRVSVHISYFGELLL
jgi:hypothetical protein